MRGRIEFLGDWEVDSALHRRCDLEDFAQPVRLRARGKAFELEHSGWLGDSKVAQALDGGLVNQNLAGPGVVAKTRGEVDTLAEDSGATLPDSWRK